MKWIGQHIWDFISRFRNDVYLENLTEVEQEFTIQVAADGKLTKSTAPSERSRIQVRNDEGSVIPAGAPLYSRGEVGGSNRIKVGICVSSDPAKMPCIGIAEFEMNISDTKDSFAITQGVYNTNISGFTGLTEGDILYVNGGVAPHLTPTKPTNGSLIQNVGIVLKAGGGGTICQGLLVSAIGRTNDTPNVIKFRDEDGVDNTSIQYNNNDISTWQLQPESFSVSTQEATPEAVFFKPDGTKMYILGRSGDDVGEYALSTAWDISTATYTDALTGLGSSPTSEPNPYGMYISPDGIYLYITGHSVDEVAQYTMSTAWDISTASYTREQDLTDAGGTFSNPTGIHFKPDGTMFWACSYDEDSIQQYTLSTAWDVSTLSVGHSFSLIDFFILNDFSGTANADLGSVEDLFFSEDGTKVWLVENSYDSVHQLKLSTAWDIRTAVYDGKGIRHSAFESAVEGIYVNETAGKAFTVSTSSDIVRSFNLGGVVFSSANDASIGFEGGIGVKGNASFSGTTSFVDMTAQAGYFYGGFATYSTSSIVHGNGGTTNINDGTTYSGDATLDVMTNVYYGANAADLSVQDTYIHNINLGRPRGGAKVTLNIGRRVGGSGTIANHTGVMDVVSMAQTFDHYGSLDVGRTLQVDGKADLEVFDLGGTVVFNDTFTETNTTAIESHTPDLGAGWTKVFDTGATTTFNIIGGAGYGQLSNTESSDGVMFLADTTPTGVDYEVRVDFKRRDSGDDVFHIIIKYQDANNYYALQWSASYSTYCKLFRVEGGSVVNVESNFNYGTMNSTSDNLSTALKLRFIDNTLMVWDIDSNDYKSFRGSYPVTTDFNDGNGGAYHKVGMAFGDLFGGGLDSTTTWKIDKFEVKMLSSAATLAAATKSYVDAGNFGVGITNPTSKFHVVGDARIQGNLTVNGTYTQIDTDVNTTEQWLVTNDGTGPAAVINQLGSQDIFDVQDDGTSVFYIEDGGHIGIGTTSPTARLHIESADDAVIRLKSTDNKAYIALSDNDTNGYISSENSKLSLGANTGVNANNLNIDLSNNNVGIGTSSPSHKLHVLSGTTNVAGVFKSEDNQAWISVQDDDSGTYGALFGTDSDEGHDIVLADRSANKRLVVDSSGNVGIGTTSPNALLDVDNRIYLQNDGTVKWGAAANAGHLTWDTNQAIVKGLSGQALLLGSNNTSARMTIDTSGNVGIGTTSPQADLQVGSVTTSFYSLSTGKADFIDTDKVLSETQMGTLNVTSNSRSAGDNSGLGPSITFSQNVSQYVDGYEKVIGGIKSYITTSGNTGENSSLGFYTHNGSSLSEKLTIDSSGNVGIGTASPSYTLDVKTSSSDDGISLSATSGRKAIEMLMDNGTNGGGDIKMYTGTSVLTNRINAQGSSYINGGNVGIGTTSPGELLEIYKDGGDVALKIHEDAGTHEAKIHLRRGGADWELINTNDFTIECEDDEKFRITTTGKVGIGTSTPDSLLELTSSSLTDFVKLTSGGSSANPIKLIFEKTASEQGIIEYNRNGDLEIYNTDSDGGVMIDGSASGGSDLYVSNSGNTTLGGRIDIQKDLRLRGTDSAANQGVVRFYVDSSNKLFIDTVNDGSNLFAIDSSGNVGIGTTSPSSLLHIEGSAPKIQFTDTSTSASSYIDADSAFGSLNIMADQGNSVASSQINLLVDGSSKMVVKDTGNVGIGTTSPSYKLQVAGKSYLSGGIQMNSGDEIDFGNGNQYITGVNDTSLTLATGGSATLTATHAGKVGIGTTNPLQELQVDGSIYANGGDLYVNDGKALISVGDLLFKTFESGAYHERARILANGNVGIGTTSPSEKLDVVGNIRIGDNNRIKIGNGGDMYLQHDGANSVLVNTNGNLTISNQADDSDIIFSSDDGAGGVATYLTIDGSNSRVQFDANIYVPDSVQLRLGSGNDLRLYHSTDSYISNEGAGDLYIQNSVNDKDIIFQSDDGSGGTETYFFLDGSEGVVNFPDDKRLTFGTGRDLFLYHDGTNATFKNYVGDIVIQNEANDKDIRFKSDDGSGGIAEYFRVDGSSQITIFSKATSHGDNVKALFGASSDLQIYHDGSNSYIQDGGTGNLRIAGQSVDILNPDANEFKARFKDNAEVELYYDNNKKFETTSTGVEVTGDLTVNGDSVQTKQMVVTTHNFQMANTTGTFFYVPFNNLNESSAATSAEYWTRSIAPYAGTIKKVTVRSHTSLGSSCQIRVSKITDTTDDLPSGTHVTNTGVDISTANTSVSTTMSTNTFAEGDVVGVALSRSAGSSARVVVTIVWEYTV